MLLTPSAFAAQLQVSARTVRREIADGRLAAVRIRGLLRIEPAEAARYIAAAREAACQSGGTATDGKFESLAAAAVALSKHYHPAPPAPTRSRSKLRCSAASSTLRLVKPAAP